MGIQVTTPTGAVFTVPESGDPDWGTEATNFLVYLANALIAGGAGVFSEIVNPPTTVVATNNQILDVTGTSLVLFNPSASVTLSSTTPIGAPLNQDGKQLTLVNINATNNVTIPDSGNVDINGPVTLGQYSVLTLRWLDSIGRWIEVSRNN